MAASFLPCGERTQFSMAADEMVRLYLCRPSTDAFPPCSPTPTFPPLRVASTHSPHITTIQRSTYTVFIRISVNFCQKTTCIMLTSCFGCSIYAKNRVCAWMAIWVMRENSPLHVVFGRALFPWTGCGFDVFASCVVPGLVRVGFTPDPFPAFPHFFQ